MPNPFPKHTECEVKYNKKAGIESDLNHPNLSHHSHNYDSYYIATVTATLTLVTIIAKRAAAFAMVSIGRPGGCWDEISR